MSGMPCHGAVAAWLDPLPFPGALDTCGLPALPSTEIDFEIDAAGRWLRLSPSWTQVMGYEAQLLLGTPALDCLHVEDRLRLAARLQLQPRDAARSSAHCGDVLRFMARDGTTRWMHVVTESQLNGQGAVIGMSGKLVDVTLRQQVGEQLRLAATVFAGTREGIVITDALGRIVEVNDAFVAITGYPRSEVLGRNAAMLVSGEHGQGLLQALRTSLNLTGAWQGEVWSRRSDGELMVELLRVRAVHSPGGQLTHYVGVFSDITAHKRQQEHQLWLAHHDMLTGLPNRALALDRLGMLIDQAKRQSQQLAVCYLDLDGFMAVNERIGHALGDGLLKAAAARAHQAVRAGDTVARLEGDEFVLLLGDFCDAAAVQPILERVLHALAQPFFIGDQQVAITASIGVALYPNDGDMPEHLLRAADQAMYRAKGLGKNRVCMASQAGECTLAHKALLQELSAAIRRDELCLHYQPQVCARTRRVLGAEALVRWQHPQRGLLAPGTFLPAIVGTPLEVELDLWVVKNAVAQLARWRSAGRTLKLSINVSPGTLLMPDMASIIAATMRHATAGSQAGLDGIELEVLETAALDDLDAAIRAIRACAQHGLTFALDDFGTGYSSLSYLRRLPVSTLKIDRSFVMNMLDSRGDLHIVRAVIGLAEAFGVATVAEGVETEEHARALAELGCEQLQGFGIARPMPAQALDHWLDEQEAAMTATAVETGAAEPINLVLLA